MTSKTEKSISATRLSSTGNSEDCYVIDALSEAAALYQRYIEITEVANIAALNQSFSEMNSQYPTQAPLGLVLWSQEKNS